jgi:hypothetical protein
MLFSGDISRTKTAEQGYRDHLCSVFLLLSVCRGGKALLLAKSKIHTQQMNGFSCARHRASFSCTVFKFQPPNNN